jgi:hypothetical protein
MEYGNNLKPIQKKVNVPPLKTTAQKVKEPKKK